jgi:PHP family Zn ribbon phosphoesterase
MDGLLMFSYCVRCWIAQYFEKIDGEWRCQECGTKLRKATNVLESLREEKK